MKQTIIALDARCIGNRNTGDTTYWSGLVLGLLQLSSDYRYLLFSNAGKPPEIPECERLRWIELSARNERWWSLAAFPLAARKMGAELLHTQYNLSPLAKRGITTIHDVSFFVGPEWFKARDRLLLQRFVPRSARRAARVITVSETSRADILRYISGIEGKVAVTPLALSPGIKRVDQPRPLSVDVEPPFLLTVGTRWPRKNMQLATEAAELISAKFRHQLIVTGRPGWGEERIGGRSKAIGWVSDKQLSELYCAADLYLAPSRYEGFGLPLLEAFECGCPVLCSTGGSLPEVAGDAAEIEPTWDATHWSATIEALLSDSSKISLMRQRGFERLKQFSWVKTAQLTEQVYSEALA